MLCAYCRPGFFRDRFIFEFVCFFKHAVFASWYFCNARQYICYLSVKCIHFTRVIFAIFLKSPKHEHKTAAKKIRSSVFYFILRGNASHSHINDFMVYFVLITFSFRTKCSASRVFGFWFCCLWLLMFLVFFTSFIFLVK